MRKSRKGILGLMTVIVLVLILRPPWHGARTHEPDFPNTSLSPLAALPPPRDEPVPDRLQAVRSRPQGLSSGRKESGSVASRLATVLKRGSFEKSMLTKEIVDALRHDGDPPGTANGVIDQLSTESLTLILTNAVGMTSEDLERIANLRTFAKNLVKGAMEGVLTPKPPNDARAINLSTMASLIPAVSVPTATAFSHETKNIYAQLPLTGYDEQAIIAKWYRKDNPSLVSVQRHALEPGADSATIWMLNANGWHPGEYGVEFFSIAEDARRLGDASFSVY